MESHFSSIHLHGSSEPAFRRQRAPAPGRFVQSFAQQRNPLLSMSFPLDSPLHLVNTIMLPIQTMETSEQGVQQYSICPPKANVLPELTRLLQLVKSHRMDLLASPPVWMTLCCTDTQLDPRLRLCTLPWWALRCFPLQCSNLTISNDLSLFFFLVKLHKPISTSAQ